MSVIGIDFGNESCYIAVARAGGIETIANDYSLRSTPSCVAFTSKNRILGVAAKNQMVTNMSNTIHGFKRLLGRTFSDPHVKSEMKHLPFDCVATSKGAIGIQVTFLDAKHTFSPEQITAMMLTKLKGISETALEIKVNDCVISVPSYFTNNERRALLDAAAIADLNVLRLLNDTTATALAYGIYKQDLQNDEPRNVVFVDCGHASLQVYACAFLKGKLRMIASACDASLGGRDIDNILASYFAEDFKKRYNINARENPRAWMRLTTEVEKIKKQMSANSTRLPLHIECFMEDKDVSGSIQRSEMESLCADLFRRCGDTMRKCLEDSQLKVDEIHAVEIVGGSSRIPAIKHLIEEIFNLVPSTTLNQDEAVARGCALQCAILSPTVRVRDFTLIDIQNYAIKMTWDAVGEEEDEIEAFSHNHPVPYSKILTFYRKEQFQIKACYTENIPYPDSNIGEYVIQNVIPTPEGKNQTVKVKLRVNLHGIMGVVQAVLVQKLPSPEEQNVVVAEETEANDTGSENYLDTTKEMGDAATDSSIQPEREVKKKQFVKLVELPVESQVGGYTSGLIDIYQEQECKMIAADRHEKERVDARNALEEYVYDLRNKLTNDDELATFVAVETRDALCRKLDATEAWLYEEGEDCLRSVYTNKLETLRAEGEPIKNRRSEYDNRAYALKKMAMLVQDTQQMVDLYRQGDEQYSHFLSSDMDKVAAQVGASSKWLEETRALLSSVRHIDNPPVTSSKIRSEMALLEKLVISIKGKPKPAETEHPITEEQPSDDEGGVSGTGESVDVSGW